MRGDAWRGGLGVGPHARSMDVAEDEELGLGAVESGEGFGEFGELVPVPGDAGAFVCERDDASGAGGPGGVGPREAVVPFD